MEIYHNRHRPSSWDPDISADTILDRIQFRQVQSSAELMRLVETALPSLAQSRISSSSPLRLVVIDALSPLVALEGPSTAALNRERTQLLNELGSSLGFLAQRFGLAVLVVNEIQDVFQRDGSDRGSGSTSARRASSQMLSRRGPSRDPYSRPGTAVNAWETQAERNARTPMRLVEIGAIDEAERKEAKLGFGWSYRLHARIMLSRTHRMWIGTLPTHPSSPSVRSDIPLGSANPSEHEPPPKKRRIDIAASSTSVAAPIAKRNLSVLFSKYSPRGSVDFVLLPSGLETLPDTLWIEGAEPSSEGRPKSGPAPTQTQTTKRNPPTADEMDNPNQHHIPSSAPARIGLPHHPPSPVSGYNPRAVSWPQRHEQEVVRAQTAKYDNTSSVPSHQISAQPIQPVDSSISRAQGDIPAAADIVDWDFYFPDGDDLTDRLSEPDTGVELLRAGSQDADEEGETGDRDREQSIHSAADAHADIGVEVEAQENPGTPVFDDDYMYDDVDLDLDLDDFFEDDALLDLDYDAMVEATDERHDLGQGDLSSNGPNEQAPGLRLSPALSTAETVSADGDRVGSQSLKVDPDTTRDGLLTRTPSLTSARSLPH